MKKLLTLTAVVCVFAVAGSRLRAERPPNIVFLLSDDQRADTIAALGNPHIETPNLDALVRRGTVFTRAHSTNPICVAIRAEILTGCRGFTNGVLMANRLDDTLPLWPTTMRDAGYDVWHVGKWHTTGQPSTRGYTDSLGLYSGGGGKYWKDQVDFKGVPITGYRGWVFQTDDGRIFPEKGVGLTANISSHFADAAIEFIRRKPERPFFLHVNFTAPHDPLIMPPGYEKKYPPDEIPLPKNYLPEHPFDHGNFDSRDEQMLPWPRTKQAVRENLAMYYRVISHLDAQIGRIVEALESTGQAENTIVIFSSDQGLAVGSHGLMGKQNMYDHTVLVPLVFAGPGIPRGGRGDALVYLRDLYPTVCDLANIDVPQSIEGRSLAPVIRGEQKKVRDRAYCYFRDVQRMVRDDRWKLIYYPKIDRYQLFDNEQDPNEMKDLAGDPHYAEKLAAMKTDLADWQRRVNDPTTDNTTPILRRIN